MKKAMASVGSQSTFSKPRAPQKGDHADRSQVRGAENSRRSEHESKEDDSSWNVTLASRRSPWDPQAGVENLPLGKRQVMDKFFTPVHYPCHGGIEARGHCNNSPHDCHHHHHLQDKEGHGYSTPGSSSRSVCQGHTHHQPHRLHTPEHLNHPRDHTLHHSSQYHSRCLEVSPHSSSHDLDPVASSSRSCSCTSSSSSWSSEASIVRETFLMDSGPQPSHSQSCSSIPLEGQGFWEEEEGPSLEALERRHPKHQHYRDDCMPKLHRVHSKSDEGLPHTNSNENVEPLYLDHSPLYKSASLGRCLAFNDYTEILLDSEKSKKVPSSILLPSKGILKNKHGQGGAAGGVTNVRKAKSLEVLSTHVDITARGLKGGRGVVGKSKLEDDMEKRKEAVRQNFVQEKLQFSAFLNEITRQVISPSRLSSLGVTDAFGLLSPGQASQKSHNKEQRVEGERQEGGHVDRQQKEHSRTPDSVVSSGHSHSNKFFHVSKHHHLHRHSMDGSSQQQHHTPGGQTNAWMTSPERCPPSGYRQGHKLEKQHQEGHNLLLTDGTSTSPELSPYIVTCHHAYSHPQPDPLLHHQKHHHTDPEKYQHHYAHHRPTPHCPSPSKITEKKSHEDTHSGVPGQESDSSQNKDTASTNSTSLEHSDRNEQICYKAAVVQNKDTVTYVDRAQCLQEENEVLHQSLLQTVAHMECMETEVKKTQVELNSVKDSFYRLQENASSTQQSNTLLEQKLQTMVLRMDAEQKRLTQRISELSKELTAAQATILSLKTINIPSLLQELLDKYFQTKEAINEFLLPAIVSTKFKDTLLNQALAPGDHQPHAPVWEGEDYGKNWLQGTEGSHHRATAFQRDQGYQLRPEGDQKGGGDTVSELEGGKEAKGSVRSSESLQMPLLQLTPQQTCLSNMLSTPAGGFHGVIAHQLGSPINVLSVCPEESCPSGNQQQCYQDQSPDMPAPAAAKSTGALQNCPSPEGGNQRDSEEDEIICKWRLRNSKGSVSVHRNSLENDASTVTYQAAQRMLDNFMRHMQPSGEIEGKGSRRGLAAGPSEESLKGEGKQ